MEKEQFYLIGPIRGMDQNNFREFKLCQEKLEALGYDVANPHQFLEGANLNNLKDHQAVMKIRFGHLMLSQKIMTLTGWENDSDARDEVSAARLAHMEIISAVVFFKNNPIGHSKAA